MVLSVADLTGILRKHYENCDLVVEKLPRRSVAFSTWDRHNAYESIEALRKDLAESVPDSVFYSTARYLNPSANAGAGKASETWKQKDRKSTDLTFDLDFDHVKGHSDMTYVEQIDTIAKHTLRLISILEQQYGVKEYQVTFSGRRGFHVRVTDEAYTFLTKSQRKQIMNDLLGERLEKKATLAAYETNSFKSDAAFKLKEPSLRDWGGKIRLACDHLMNNFDTTSQAVLEKYWPKKLTPKELQNLMPRLSNPSFRQRLVRTGDLRAFFGEKLATKTRLENMYAMLLSMAKEKYAVEIDTSVTAEVNKIIRMPGSINTKHGYECRVIEIDELMDMDYLFHNSAQTFGNKQVQVQIDKPMTVQGYRTFSLDKGIHTLPMHEAVLALCQSERQ